MASARTKLIGLIGAGTLALVVQHTGGWEGTRNVGYLDVAGVPTKCTGDTTDVIVGHYYTDEQCQESFDRALLKHTVPALECVPQLKGKTFQLAAAIDMAYNAGPGGFCSSKAAQLFREGRDREACEAIRDWRVTINKGAKRVRGLVNRRLDTVEMCLKGVQ
ncbi:MAG TPA: glycoside hydrolase family protein [Nitratidesulfovibrio sp.]|nr:glycoside hydrolase family protein [Nitratidesulfovibrio sp.]